MYLVGVVVKSYIDFHITYPYSSCICFFSAASLLFVQFINIERLQLRQNNDIILLPYGKKSGVNTEKWTSR